uniref:Uncharacterized protein n=1 Tax=Rhizophora mucronata TaxID=61149 RepID=A0A2P2QMF7_RHIMU
MCTYMLFSHSNILGPSHAAHNIKVTSISENNKPALPLS